MTSVASLLRCSLLIGSLLVPPSRGLVAPAQAKASSWQRRLDRALLDIDATPEARLRSFQRAVQDPALIADVAAAVDAVRTQGFGKGHPELINRLWPTGTTARSDLEGLAALRTQLPEALKELPDFVKASREASSATPASLPTSVVDFASLPTPEAIGEELKNALRSTPKGLEAPKYSVVRTVDGEVKLGVPERVEIRQYAAFTLAAAPSRGGAGFTTLASYLFGGNEEKEAMAMTMPVITTGEGSGGDGAGTMRFVLPAAASAAPPTPLAGARVDIERVPERLVAAKAFPGLVTEEEVARQKAALLAALASDGALRVREDEVSVLQYNAPFTIPWRRRNEIAVVVEPRGAGDGDGTAALHAWRSRETVVSYYDAGVRLQK